MIARIVRWSGTHRAIVLSVVAALCALAVAMAGRMQLDALPDLSDAQVIVYSRWERAPDLIEDQVTYPIVSGLLGMPRVRAIRGFSDFGYSFVYAIFEDGTDANEARARVLERLSAIGAALPDGVRTQLGPDASGLGWVFQYALVDRSGRVSPDELRAIQDFELRYAVQSVPGVAEVAPVGGFAREYQIALDPVRLRAFDLSLDDVLSAVRDNSGETGGRLVEWAGAEYMVRGRGYGRTVADWEGVVLRAAPTPVHLGDVATVSIGPQPRRGVADLDGDGDVVGGIVVMRHGENAVDVIDAVRDRLESLRPSLPDGVEIVTTYDRADLIRRALQTLRGELILEMLVVAVVIALFLSHFPSAVVPIVTLPVSVLLSAIPLALMGVSVNIMSLAGIAISIGVLVDGAIVEVENAYNRVHRWLTSGRDGDFHDVRLRAMEEVGPAVFFSLLVIAASFLPIFALTDQEGRLFTPLAISKTLAMAVAAVLAITLDPALRMLFARIEPFTFRPRWLARLATALAVGRYRAEHEQPLSAAVARLYEPACRFVLRYPRATVGAAIALVLVTVPSYLRLGREFMPPLDEGALLFMPTTLPGIGIADAQALLTAQDRVLREVPEVERVFGKAGRAETATDPAPLSMFETTIVLKPTSEWRARSRWYSDWPEPLKPLLRPFWPDRIDRETLIAELDARLQIPGVANAWTMPIKARTDMLSTGVRTPLGIKVRGPDLAEIERIGVDIERLLRPLPGTRSVFAERAAEGFFVDVEPRRDLLDRYGLRVADVHRAVEFAIGGEPVGTVIDGRRRFPVTVRYGRELRDDRADLSAVLLDAPSGAKVPLGDVADIEVRSGPAMIRDEGGFLAGYVFVDIEGSDVGGYVDAAKAAVAPLSLPDGYSLEWSGQWENMQRVRDRLRWLVPIALCLVFFLLYANTGSAWSASVVMLAVPFSAIGAVWLFDLLGYNVSIAAWVGLIALLGLDAETGVFMLLFLDVAVRESREAGTLVDEAGIDEAMVHGAVRRVRPKLMTVAAAFLGLLPILFSDSAGSDVMKRIAAPMIGGLASSFVLELLVYPAIYKLRLMRTLREAA